MRDQLVARIKSVLRPIVKHRALIERFKYIGTPILSPDAGNDYIAKLLHEGKPRALGKMGASELGGLRRFEAKKDSAGICHDFGRHRRRLHVNAGVYPDDDATLSRFCQAYALSLPALDVLGVWFQFGQRRLVAPFAPHARLIALTGLEPYFYPNPWSRHLAGKRVLVISPFTETIKTQYARRQQIWPNPAILPAFELDTLRCPLSAGLMDPVFPDWFAALDAMRQEMSRRNYDVLIVGAGAWSLPLVAHAKSQGKWAIHLGGAAQLMFGIRGGRWDNHPFLKTIYNDCWVRPGPDDRPQTFRKIENGCYW